MSINISSFAGAGAQFFDANGDPLSGGLLYTYAAGTTTLATTYTSKAGTTANSNPIVLDSAGRVPYEIWLTGGAFYKFALKSSVGVLIGTYDNIPPINDTSSNSNFLTVSGTNTLTATASPTVTSYLAGAQYSFVAQNTNTGAVTINIDGTGAKAITKNGATALGGGDIISGQVMFIEYDGTQFQLLNTNAFGDAFAAQIIFGI